MKSEQLMDVNWFKKDINFDKDADGNEVSLLQPVGAYTLDVYCVHTRLGVSLDMQIHSFDEFPHQFFTHTYAQAKSEARRSGWVFHKNGFASCPKCAKRLKLKGRYLPKQ